MAEHRLMEALRLDEFQRRAARAEETAVVTAGAGAGKTRALVGRFLYLILEKGIEPENILALTFTRKAAAEMSQRVHEALSTSSEPRPDLAARLISAHIQTLDSFCREIVALSSTLYGYTPDFQIDEEACAETTQKTAYRYVLEHREAAGLKSLLGAFGFELVVRELFASFGSTNVGPHWSGRHLGQTSARLGEKECAAIAAQLVEELRQITAQILSLAGDAPALGFKEGTKQAIRAATAFSDGASSLNTLSTFLLYMQNPENAINLRSVGRNDLESAIKELAQKLRDKTRLKKISQILDFERFLPDYRAIMERLDEYADLLCQEKRRANIMNYRDLGALAVDILSSQEEVRQYWASRFQYILIDEFQDNNDLQKRLLLLLGSEQGKIRRGKLFFVGDEKQSIYLFRGADVSVFKALADELGATRFSLARNYRSAHRLIEFFNAAFTTIMRPADERQPKNFEAEYQDMEASDATEPPGFEARVEYHCVTGEVAFEEAAGSFLSPKESMAYRLARWIRGAVESAAPVLVRDVSKTSGLRRAEYGDMAVLMRSTRRQYELEKYLRLLAIPFVTDTTASLFAEEPVNDLYYLLRLLLDADDLFATAAVLRSPLCRISNDGYVAILTEKLSLGGLWNHIPEVLGEEDRASVKRMLSFYDALRKEADHLPLMELVTRVWEKANLEQSILSSPRRLPYLEHWNAVRAIAADTEASGGQLQAFLATLRNYMRRKWNFEASSAPKREAQGVHLLTIHKSKGLEFPIVIIPWMEAGTNRSDGSELWGVLESVRAEEEHRFYTVDIGFHDRVESGSNILQTQAKELRRQKEQAEIKRLLYVACTRAIDHLIMFNAAPDKRPYDKDSFHALLFQGTGHLHPLSEATEETMPPHLSLLRVSFEPLASEDEVYAASRGDTATAQSAAAQTSVAPVSAVAKTLPPPARLTASAVNAAAAKDPWASATARELEGYIVHEHLFDPPVAMSAENGATQESLSTPTLNPTEYGTLAHELLAHLASGKKLEYFVPSTPIARELHFNSATPGTRTDAKNVDALPEPIGLAFHQLEPFLKSEFFTEMSRQAKLKFEFPFLLGLSPWMIEGRMDLLAESDDQVVVLDLKTDQRLSPRDYALQLGIYRIAAHALFPTKRIRAGLFYLHFGEIDWLEHELEEEPLLRICDTISYNHSGQ